MGVVPTGGTKGGNWELGIGLYAEMNGLLLVMFCHSDW